MPMPSLSKLLAAVAVLCALITPGYAEPSERKPKADIGFFEIDVDRPRSLALPQSRCRGIQQRLRNVDV